MQVHFNEHHHLALRRQRHVLKLKRFLLGKQTQFWTRVLFEEETMYFSVEFASRLENLLYLDCL